MKIVTWLLVAACVVVGAALRAWCLFHHPITSDEAIAGLMAQQALHGHFSAFYWGQSYGGVEPYLIAFQYRVFGFTPSLLGGVATVLAMGSGLVDVAYRPPPGVRRGPGSAGRRHRRGPSGRSL